MKIVETAIAFARLPSEEKHPLFQQVRAFDQQIFPNAAREQLQQYVYDKDAVSVPIVQYRHEGKLIGQNIIQILTLRLAEKPVLIVSSRAGFLPEYRLRSQADAYQQFFRQHAPDYFDGMGLMCICRLDFRTIAKF